MNRIFKADDESTGRIHDQLTKLTALRKQYSRVAASVHVIEREQLSHLIETAFWASLKSNEGRTTRAFIAVASPESFPEAAAFAIPLSYDEQQVAKPVLPTPLENLGGTRHQSAARFAAANKDSVALVISQDRHMSVVHWHEPIQAVAVVRNAEWWV